MVHWPIDWDYPRLLLVALGVTTVVALVIVASTSTAAFGTYNPAWDGASDLREVSRDLGVDATVARNLAPYNDTDPNETVALVLSPSENYTDAEAARLRRFLERGGTLVVAEDFGTAGNTLLADLGASSRINGSLLRDERFFLSSPAMPHATNVSNHMLTAGVDRVTINHGSAVEANGANVIVRTSGFAYLDIDRDAELDDTEEVESYPVITVEAIGNGTLVVAGDPSLFINVMLEQPGNRAFVENLFGSSSQVVLDYSHAGGFPPLALLVLVLRGSPFLQGVLGFGGLALISIWTWRPGWIPRLGEDDRAPRRTPELTEEEVVAYLEREHPDWEDERVRRVVRGVLKDEPLSRRDD